MDSIKVCDKCGLEIPADAPDGRCPRCLMAAGMETLGAETLLEAELERSEPIELEVFEEIQGKYTMLGEHARGGMGRVLLVHDESLGRQVALKELLPGRGSSSNSPTPAEAQQAKELASRFLREARITGQLEHPSITPVHELGRREDGSLYYTMKLVKGKTLKDAIKECETLEERLKLLPHFVDLCNAIAYAHSRNVIHRDIKPANVMIGEYGETVILDWGLAKVKDSDEVGDAGQDTDPNAETVMGVQQDTPTSGHKTSAGQLLGTPVYMSPEQAKGLPADERSDIYSLGAVLYEILTGKPPFDGKTVDEIIAKVIYEEPESTRKIDFKIQPNLAKACEKATRKNQADRFGSASEFGQRIQSIKLRTPRGRLETYINRSLVSAMILLIIGIPLLTYITQQLLDARYDMLQREGISVYYDDMSRYFLLDQGIDDGPRTESYTVSEDVIGALYSLHERYPAAADYNSRVNKKLGDKYRMRNSGVSWSDDDWATLEQILKENQALLNELSQIARTQGSSRETVENLLNGVNSPLDVPIPDASTMYFSSNLLRAAALLDIHEGNYDAALIDINDALALVSHMRYVSKKSAVSLEFVLRRFAYEIYFEIPIGQISTNSELRQFTRYVDNHSPRIRVVRALEAELNSELWFLNTQKSGQSWSTIEQGRASIGGYFGQLLAFPFRPIINYNEVVIIDGMAQAIISLRQRSNESDGFENDENKRDIETTDTTNSMMRPFLIYGNTILRGAKNATRSVYKVEQLQRIALLSIDLRRYAREHRDLPDSLADFVSSNHLAENVLTGESISYSLDDEYVYFQMTQESYNFGGSNISSDVNGRINAVRIPIGEGL